MSAHDTGPEYYRYNKIQPWDVIESWQLDFWLGSALKYICRLGRKESANPIQDLEKAIHYLQFAKERLERSA